MGHGFHILIIDDNSPDGTGQIVSDLQAKFGDLQLMIRKTKSGLGSAYLDGFKYALEKKYDYVFEMDADFSHPPEDLIKLHDECQNNGFDMAIGSRYISGVNVVNWPIGRVLMSFFASKYVQLITGLPVQDATAGFKCYRAKVLRTLELDKIRFVGYGFQIEMKFLAWKYGFKIKEVPIIFTDRTKGTSKMSAGIFSEALLGVVYLKVYSLFRKYHAHS